VAPALALESLTLCGPIYEPLHVVAVFPGKMKKLLGRQIGRFFAEKRFEAPPQIRTFPGIQSITASRIPIVLQCLKHFCAMGETPSPRCLDSIFSDLLASWEREFAGGMFRSKWIPYCELAGIASILLQTPR
jgi:hypothetical protein